MRTDERIKWLRGTMAQRILVLDGAMGTSIQSYKLSEQDFRGERFRDFGRDVKGNNDLLNLTASHIIREIHDSFLEAGADIVSTNTFNSTQISQADYGMEDLAYELNREGARLAREAADAWSEKTPDRRRFVAGSLGPTNKTLSISPDVNNPAFREVSFDWVKDNYRQAAEGLIDGGADLLLLETIFDTLNAKASIAGIQELADETGKEIPLLISGTITDLSGRTLSGQTVIAFWHSVRHAKPFAVGLNCSFGADELRPHVADLAHHADVPVIAYPNAGLPNEMGDYDETPEMTAAHIRGWAEEGLVNIVGGCCGTTPDHIKAIADAMQGMRPRAIPENSIAMRLSGLEAVTIGL